MPRVRFYPHRVAAPSAVEWGEWWIEHHGSRFPMAEKVDGWDYATEVRVGRPVCISLPQFVETTGIEDLSDVELVAIAECRSTQYRTVARINCSESGGEGNMTVALRLSPGEFASEVSLATHLTLARYRPASPDRTAVWKGARLASSKTETLRLEGDAGRFPTEPVAFSALYLAYAPWSLQCTFEDLDESFMGAVRLFINTEHPVGRLALDPVGAKQVGPLLRTDVVRQLVAEAARRTSELPSSTFEEGSVGEVLASMTQFFLGRDLRAATQLYKEEPNQFELVLHERLNPSSVVLT